MQRLFHIVHVFTVVMPDQAVVISMSLSFDNIQTQAVYPVNGSTDAGDLVPNMEPGGHKSAIECMVKYEVQEACHLTMP